MKNWLFLPILLVFNIWSNEIVDSGHAKVSLLTNLNSEQQESFFVGVKLDMADGWHTYWKNPGDSGGVFEIDWQAPEGMIIENVSWPTPQLIPYPPLMTYGYEGVLILPFKVFRDTQQALSPLEATINFLICSDICIPEQATVAIDLNQAQSSDELQRAIAGLPTKIIPVITKDDGSEIMIEFNHDAQIQSAYFFVDQPGIFLHPPAQTLNALGNNRYELTLPKDKNDVEEFSGVLKINDAGYLVLNANLEEIGLSILTALLFAFLGGLILNLMPCVFPVIALKVLSFAKLARSDNASIRSHALVFTSGVLISFLAIAGIIIALKAGGSMIGWGFQLQSPEVVGGLTLIMVLIGFILLSNLNLGMGLTSIGSTFQTQDNHMGSFATGVLAVVVASPCTAPFMGAAIGFAILQPSWVSVLIFIALGLGFALPYLSLAFRPKLINILPKPGAWMDTLKQFFAFPMFATALWLVWVFSLQTSQSDLILLITMILVIGLGIWLLTKLPNKFHIGLWVLLILLSVGSLLNINPSMSSNQDNQNSMSWNPEIEADLRSKNQAYLINFTAAWCITCQVNERVALSSRDVKDFFNQNNISYIKADWTNRNNDITMALAKYKRTGVPLYIFWKPGMNSAKVLPAVLTEGYILNL